MAASRPADLLVLVTEPTPFGLHDLELAVGMGRALGRRLAAVVNRADLGDNKTKKYLMSEQIPILAEIPFSHEVAKSYAAADLAIDECETFKRSMIVLGERLNEMLGSGS